VGGEQGKIKKDQNPDCLQRTKRGGVKKKRKVEKGKKRGGENMGQPKFVAGGGGKRRGEGCTGLVGRFSSICGSVGSKYHNRTGRFNEHKKTRCSHGGTMDGGNIDLRKK